MCKTHEKTINEQIRKQKKLGEKRSGGPPVQSRYSMCVICGASLQQHTSTTSSPAFLTFALLKDFYIRRSLSCSEVHTLTGSSMESTWKVH